MKIYEYNGKSPKIDETAYVSEDVVITGDVSIGKDSSVWFGTVIRGDFASVTIGENVNIQENSVIHESVDIPVVIEDNITVGHMCILHSCTIRKNALIGMGSIILDNAEIGEGSIIGAGSLVPGGKVIPPNVLAMGRPAKVIRELTPEEIAHNKENVALYIQKGQKYKTIQK